MTSEATVKPSRGTLQQHPLQAIGLMMGAVFMLSSMDVAIKLLVEHYGRFQVVLLRSIVSIPLFAGWILLRDRTLFRTAYPGGHLIRGLVGLTMLWTVGECFRELQLADAYAIYFAAPLLLTLLSGPILGEPAGFMRIIAAVVGFAGVLVVLQPQGDQWITYGAAMGLLGVCFYAVSTLLLRSMGQRDRTVTIAFWFATVVGLGAAVMAIPGWKAIDPTHWLTIGALGVTGTVGQLLITAAFRKASIAVVAPFDYIHMFWAVLYGWLFWAHIPSTRTWVGGAIVVASGLFIIYRERRRSLRASQQAAMEPVDP